MAIRRTTGISSVVSSIDRRVKAVESGQTTLSAQYANAITVSVSDDDDPNNLDPETNSGTDKKYEYKRVLKAYIYGDKVTGFGSRCELYFGEDPQIEATDPVDVQGINGTSTDDFNISPKQFKVFDVDSSPWTGRQSWRNTPTTGGNGDTITNTVWFNPVVEVPSSYPRTSGRELITTRLIDTVDIDGTTVTVNLNSTHKFELGDIISVDLPQPAFGIDGLFRISDVPDTSTIVYELSNPVASPVTLDSGDFTGGEAYVYPVARRYIKDGTVWIDESVTPERVWVWNVMRWYDTAEPIGDVSAVKDGIAPSPVTNLTATSTTIPGANGQGGTAEISVSWTAPTTRSNGDPIANYLGYYEIQYKRTTETNWTGRLEVAGNLTSAVIRDPFIRLLTEYDIRVYVYDIMEQPSNPTSTTVTTTNFSQTLNAPSQPILTTRLGTITVTWDGLDSAGNSPVQGVRFVEVHYSTTSNFTPGPTTLYTTFPLTLQSNYAVVSNLNYNTTYYFKLRFVRSDGYSNETSAASAQGSAIVASLVDTDIINSTLNNWPFNGGVVPAGALASGAINAANIFGPNVITQNAISANAIGAQQIAAGSIVAGKIAANAITAAEIAANTISAGMLKANSIEADKIAAGAITASIINSKEIELKETLTSTQRIVLNASGITAYNGGDTTFFINGQSGTINAASITVSNITANNITTGTLSADRIAANSITAGKLSSDLVISGFIRTAQSGNRIEIRGSDIANPGIVHLDGVGGSNFRFYTNGVSYLNDVQIDNASLSGSLTVTGTISGGTIVGAAVRTSTDQAESRAALLGGPGRLVFFAAGSTSAAGTITAGTGSSTLSLTGGGTASVNIGLASTTVAGNLSTGGTANILAAGRLGQNSWALTGTRIGGVSYNDTGLLVPSASDQRLKTNIESIPLALEKILELNPVTFNWKTDDTNQSKVPGLIAQEVSQVFGESEVQIVRRLPEIDPDPASEFSNDPMMAVEYEAIIPYLIKAMQELSTKNEALEARLAALEGNG